MDYNNNNNYQPNGNNQPVDPNFQQYNAPQGYEQPQYKEVPQGYEYPQYNQVPQGNQQYNAPQYQTPQYGQPMYGQPPVVPDNSKGFAIASLIIGILSVTCCCGGWLPSILAVVFGIISKNRKKENNGMALAGIILGAIGIVFSIILIIFMATGGLEDFVNEMYYY